MAVGERFRVLSVGALCVIAAACSSGPARTQGAATTSSWSVAPATSSSVTTTTIRRRVTRPARPAVVLVVKGPVTAIGDSVMIDAAPALRTTLPEVTIDAAVDRSAIPGPAILLARARSGRLGSSIIVELGTNGGVSASIIGQMLDVAAGRRVVMVTSHCGYCSWTPAGNAVMRVACTRARNCFVADWDTLAAAHPAWFGQDGVHMAVGGEGAAAFAHLVWTQLSRN